MRQLDGADVSCRVPRNIGRDAVELVKPVRGRQALRGSAQVPLAENRGGIACALE